MVKKKSLTIAVLISLAVLIASVGLPGKVRGQEPEKPEVICIYGMGGFLADRFKELKESLGVQVVSFTNEDIKRKAVDLSSCRLIILGGIRGLDSKEDKELLEKFLVSANKQHPNMRIVVGGRGAGQFQKSFPGLIESGTVEKDAEIEKYTWFQAISQENMRRYLVYLAVTYLGRPGKVEPPEKYESRWFYHPDHEGTFASVEEFLQWARKQGRDIDAPRALIETNMGHVVHRPEYVDMLIRAFEKHGMLAAAINTIGETYEKYMREFKPDLLMRHTGKSGKVEFYISLGAPVIQPMSLMGETIDEWLHPEAGDTKRPRSRVRGFQMISESRGIIEPHAVAGPTVSSRDFFSQVVPIPDRMEHFIARAAAWCNLRRKHNRDKKLAIQYLGPPDKGEMLVGTQDTLYAESIINLLKRMKREGYVVNKIPKDQDELIDWMIDHGRQILSDAPDELDKLARSGKAVLLPVETYRKWFEAKVPEEQRKAVIKEWGEIPGKFMVWKDDRGKQFLVIPKIDLDGSKVILVPKQFPEGEDALDQDNREALLKRLREDPYNVQPSHNELAANFWIEEGFKTDALVVWEFLIMDYCLPRKAIGLRRADWPDILMGNMPNVRVWPICELNWSLPARRKTRAVLDDHLVSPDVNAELADELLNLQTDIIKWDRTPEGALEEKFRASITQQVRETHLDQDLRLDLKRDQLLTPEEIRSIAGYLSEIYHEKINVNYHVMGQPPRDDLLAPYVVTCLGGHFLDGLDETVPVPPEHDRLPGDRKKYLRQKAQEVIEKVLKQNQSPGEAIASVGGKIGEQGMPRKLKEGFDAAKHLHDGFARTHMEIDNYLVALNGRFMPPGPGNLPERNPAVLPTGRNMYIMNPEEIPSKPSWELGKQLVDQLLAEKLKTDGCYPEKIGLSLNFRSTLMDYGVLESQILYLIGVRPVWDASNRVMDVALIPSKELGRPRIDVFVETYDYYVDYLEGRLRLWDKAIRMVSELDEPNNNLFKNRTRVYRELKVDGLSQERAETLSRARIFAMAPELVSYTHFLLLEETGKWDSRLELVDVYLEERDYAYTEGCWGEKTREAYRRHLQGTGVVLKNVTRGGPHRGGWYNGGNLCLVIKEVTGKEPDYFISDLRNPGEEEVVRAEDAMRKDIRATLFNRKWIEGMMEEGYAGAQQMAGGVFCTLGWEINREDSVSADIWEEIVNVYLRDKKNLNIREWFEAKNPYAFQGLTENLLEAIRKEYWRPDEATLLEIATAYAESVVRHGHSEPGEVNEKLDFFLARTLSAPGPDSTTGKVTRALLEQYRQKTAAEMASSRPEEAAPAPPVEEPEEETVEGKKMEPVKETSSVARTWPLTEMLIGLVVILVIYAGYRFRKGAPRFEAK